jgi:hypothetical protein
VYFATDEYRRTSSLEEHRARLDVRLSSTSDQMHVDVEIGETVAWLEAARVRMRDQVARMGEPYPLIFAIFVEGPLWHGRPVPRYRDVTQQCRLTPTPNENQIAGYVARMRKSFDNCLRQVVAEVTGSDKRQIDEALAQAKQILGDRSRAREIIDALRGEPIEVVDELETLGSMFVPLAQQRLDLGRIHQVLRCFLEKPCLEEAGGQSTSVSPTARQVLCQDHGEVAWWRRLKALAKNEVVAAREPMSKEVAMAFYLTSIAGALVRHGARISKKNDTELRDDFRQAIEQVWLTTEMRHLLREAIDSLSI